jgi:hypothetical protein
VCVCVCVGRDGRGVGGGGGESCLRAGLNAKLKELEPGVDHKALTKDVHKKTAIANIRQKKYMEKQVIGKYAHMHKPRIRS